MQADDGTRATLASLRRYLEELKESGVEGLPFAPEGAAQAFEAARPPISQPLPAESECAVSAPPQRREILDDIRSDLGDCQRCALGAGRTTLVFGVGNPDARLLFVGEAPGREEDLQGEPFVGEAGQLLTKIIGAMGLAREEVYICNVLKCRPPGNRNPHAEEIEACSSFLLRQVKAIAPEAIIALGTFAAQTLLNTKEPISRLRGTFHDYHGIPLMSTFHPAFLLRNPERKREVWDDMKLVMGRLGIAINSRKK
ncbi:uracil-DNA glycosylase [Geobacter pickeringii]|uniref:Type-4 uracil-DNA glycosylase n=1 Tax=Geobacter pickeringii TaxID=345632 RepID=A0A0B5BF92_9BACT|nr:uracil-DNA glycosylase [Geobacter pickeringii]AJE03814.1 uracil-DNA glycosylase [Geobacter pickeringii]